MAFICRAKEKTGSFSDDYWVYPGRTKYATKR